MMLQITQKGFRSELTFLQNACHLNKGKALESFARIRLVPVHVCHRDLYMALGARTRSVRALQLVP